MRSPSPSRGGRARARPPGRCTSVARSTRSPRPSAPSPPVPCRIAPSSWSRSPRSSTRRAPPGRHVAWAYCHVPHAFPGDATAALEGQIERFAPGFRELVLARSVRGPAALEQDDANLIGGDIGGGEVSLRQTVFRPVARPVPWSTPIAGVFLCSASTPPGGGVHGMCGYFAARSALRAAARGVRYSPRSSSPFP